MTNFIYNNTTVPINKMNAAPLPPGANPAQWAVAAEWITLCQALLDIQGWARGAQWMGYTPLAVDPAPAGIADYIWLRNDGALMHNGTPFAGGGGGVSSVGTGVGLTGGPITTSGTISLANTAVTPGTYNNVTLTVDAQGRITAASNGTGGGLTFKSQGASVNGPSPSLQFQALGITPDGSRVYVGSQGGAEAWRFLTSTDEWVTTAPAAIPLNYVRQFVFNATGTKMYVLLLSDTSTIYIVDTATNLVTGTVTGLPLATYNTMALQPVTNELWVHYDAGPNFIGRINTTTDTLITSFTAATGNAYSMCFNPAGTKMYYTGADSLGAGQPRFHIYNATTYTLIITINDTPLYRAVVPLPDGTEVWVSIDGTGPNSTLVRYSTTTDSLVGTPMLTSQDTGGPFHLVAKSDSTKVYALLNSGDIDVFTVASHTVTNTIAMSGQFAGDLIINPASTRLYASKTQGTKPYWVKVIDVATELVIDTIDGGSVPTPAPTTVGSFDTMRITGADVTDDGGGQVSVALPIVYDTGSAAFRNIKANRPFPDSSIVDQTKAGITNFGLGSTASGTNATIGGGSGNTASGDSSTVPGGDGNEASGEGSVAMGFGSTAEGEGSLASNAALVRGDYAAGFGYAFLDVGTEACFAAADGFINDNTYGSTALNGGSIDNDANYCHAEGSAFIDNGADTCHAEGDGTYIGQNVNGSHVEGSGCSVEGDNAHAEGEDCEVLVGCYQGHAEGGGCTVSAPSAHAEGVSTEASGYYAHAEGGATLASGEGSHSEGDGGWAEADWSHTQGSRAHGFWETVHAQGHGYGGGFGSGDGTSQSGILGFRLNTTAGPAGSNPFRFGVNSGGATALPLQDGRVYDFEFTAVIVGVTGGPTYKSRTIKIKLTVRCVAGVATIAGSGTTEAYGDAATWTVTPTAVTNTIVFTFDTGTDTHSCTASARLSFVQQRFL